MAKCGMKMPREVAILIAEKGRHSRREVVADPENLGSLSVIPVCLTSSSSRYAPPSVFPVCLRAGIHCFLSFYRLPRGLSRQPHPGMTIVNESGDDGEGKGQNQDLDPGSRAYRDDDEVGHTGMTGILNLRGLWPQFFAMGSGQILQRRSSRILRSVILAAIPLQTKTHFLHRFIMYRYGGDEDF